MLFNKVYLRRNNGKLRLRWESYRAFSVLKWKKLQIPLSKNTDKDLTSHHLCTIAHLDQQHQQRHETVATKINDELRYSIIDAIYLRPAIWDHGREPKSLGQRKDYFIEIAALLSTEDNILSCYDIEKQWKNLKDTYLKIRKKVVTDESGCIIPPRWKFFSAMTFLDQLNTVHNNSLNNHHINNNSNMVDNNNDNNNNVMPQQSTNASSSPNHSNSILGKRSFDHKNLEKYHNYKDTTSILPCTSSFDPQQKCISYLSTSKQNNNGAIIDNSNQPVKSFYDQDEYVVFCNSLIYPLREIGSISRVELLKIEKEIRDIIHEKQMLLLQGHE
ncbi:unnamed protein product [Anisakis simplex]|uniref:MADF domain-containing protein n=1 Tax=Anisakis simplex TaxID=6269 RepID=A0A0M3JRY5_ANISI|nr:unnamed protein product [Anisakis simplex]